MGLRLHRQPPLTLEEWKVAVEVLPGLRLAADPNVYGRNPLTGETIALPGGPGRVEVLFDDVWDHGFTFRDGEGHCEDELYPQARQLADALGADLD